VLAFPDFICEGGMVGVYDVFNTVHHDTQGLVGPEVATGVGEVLVFEEEFVSESAIKHKIGLREVSYVFAKEISVAC